MENFKDNFSEQSGIYVKYRPHYPVELYAYLASLTEAHNIAWDCGTGNGQAAVDLANYYDQVVATDPSEQQIKNSIPHPHVKYLVEKAEENSLQPASVDLITVANAIHWFDFEAFYKEVKRVLKKNGIIAAWSYRIPTIAPGIDEIIKEFNDVFLNDYWLYENRLVEKEYKTIPFPFTELGSPAFVSERIMNLDEFTGFLNTWSAVQRFIHINHYNPTDKVKSDLEKLWTNAADKKKVSWRLTLKVGRFS